MRKLNPNGDRARMATTFMWLSFGASILLLIAELNELLLLKRIQREMGYSEELISAIDSSDLFVSIASLINLGLLIGTAIVFIMWFRRAYYNLHQLLRSGLRLSEGWAAGAWFIPVYSLWAPYNIATDLFSETEKLLVNHSLTEAKQKRHVVKGWWWAFWIISSITGSIEVNMANTYDIDTLVFSSYIGAFSTICNTAAAFLAIKVIRDYHEMEVLLPQISDVEQVKTDHSDILDSGL